MKRKSLGEESRHVKSQADLLRDNAIEKLIALFERGVLAPGNFSEIIITHEEACRQRVPGPCNCNPRFEIIRPWMVPRKLQ